MALGFGKVVKPISLVVVALAVCVAAGLSACGGSESASSAPSSRTLKLSFLQDPGQPPDPDIFYGAQGLVLTSNIYEGLLAFRPGVAEPILKPALATKWTASKDNRTFTFKLREGVTFHDGTPFTSAAIKASFDRRLAVNEGPAYMVEDVASVTTEGKYSVKIVLKEPEAAFLLTLASPYGPRILSPAGLKAHAGNDDAQTYLETHDLGTGPYQLTQARVGDFYQLEAYSGYWGKKPYFTTVDLPVITDSSAQQLQFKSGSLAAILHDIPSSAVKSYKENDQYDDYSLPTESVDYMYLNPNGGLLSDQTVRNALLSAVDIDQIAENAFFGRATPAKQIYPANINDPKYAAQEIPFDSSLLKDALDSQPEGEHTVTIGYDASSPDNQQVANLMVGQLAAAGLTAKVQSFPPSQIYGWVENREGAPDILVNGGWPDAPSPYYWMHINFDPDGGVNFFGCSSPKATKLLAEGRRTGSDQTFSEAAHAAQDTGCWMNLVDIQDFMVAQKWLKGIEEAHLVTNPQSLQLNLLSAE